MFIPVTSSKYIGPNGLSLIQSRTGLFSICKDGVVTSWGTSFQTVKSAEIFMNDRDYKSITCSSLPIEEKDLDFIQEIYGMSMKRTGHGNEYQLISDPFVITVPEDFKENHQVILKAESKEDIHETIDDVEQLLLNLDSLESEIVACSLFRGSKFRSVLAKNDRRSSKEIVKDLIRVKSSNVWAYGVEIKDSDAKIGDVYVQFKGKEGGPADVYRYYDVPVSLWRKFITAPSKGHFLWKYLRNNFLYSKLTGDKKGKLLNAVN